MMIKIKTYGKWEDPEDSEIAFEAVKYGFWDLQRFQDWLDHVRIVEQRDALDSY